MIYLSFPRFWPFAPCRVKVVLVYFILLIICGIHGIFIFNLHGNKKPNVWQVEWILKQAAASRWRCAVHLHATHLIFSSIRPHRYSGKWNIIIDFSVKVIVLLNCRLCQWLVFLSTSKHLNEPKPPVGASRVFYGFYTANLWKMVNFMRMIFMSPGYNRCAC